MALVRKAKETDGIELIDAGTYEVECIAVQEHYQEIDLYGNHDKLIFTLEVDGQEKDDGSAFELDAWCNDIFSETSTLWGYLFAFGLNPEKGRLVDVEECIGRRALAEVVQVTGKKQDGATTAPVFNRVKKLMQLPKAAVKIPRQKKSDTNMAADRKEPDDLSEWLHFNAAGDLEANWNAFWATASKYKIKRSDIFKELGIEPADFPGDVDRIQLPAVLSKLAVPF